VGKHPHTILFVSYLLPTEQHCFVSDLLPTESLIFKRCIIFDTQKQTGEKIMSQEKLVEGDDWRSILKKAEEESRAEEAPKLEKLELIAGDWAITFLDNGNAYSFERNNKTTYGVSFVVNAKHITSGGNFPNVAWGITANSILKLLEPETNLIGCVLKLTATGSGMQRRYPSKTLIAPKVK